VYGMPKAVVDAGVCRAVLPLPNIANYLCQQIEGRP
jgi:chemotaxis response regulator CheB